MWSGFVVTMPWQVYLNYGDKGVLATNYPMMRRWLDFADSRTKAGILEPYVSVGIRMPQWNYLGDWVTPRRGAAGDLARDPVAGHFINTAHYLYTLQLASRIASILDRPGDVATYTARAAEVARALHEKYFVAAENSYATGQQPYLALALLLGIAPPDVRPAAMKNLEDTILTKNTGHFDAGMHGTYFLLKELMDADRNDLIYTMAEKEDFPSWGNMLKQGATTSWESWTGGSHIHDTLISIGAWFIEGIGAIRVDERAPGFRHFFLKPAPGGGLTFARARYHSIRGTIVSNWRIENGMFRLDATVPPGTTATLYLPSAASGPVTEGGHPASDASGVSYAGMNHGHAIFELNAGSYQFVSKLP